MESFLNSPLLIACKICSTNFTSTYELLPKALHDNDFKVFRNVINVGLVKTPGQNRSFSEAHLICMNCNTHIGWKYDEEYAALTIRSLKIVGMVNAVHRQNIHSDFGYAIDPNSSFNIPVETGMQTSQRSSRTLFSSTKRESAVANQALDIPINRLVDIASQLQWKNIVGMALQSNSKIDLILIGVYRLPTGKNADKEENEKTIYNDLDWLLNLNYV